MYKNQPKERSVAQPRRQAALGVAPRPFLGLCMFLLLSHALAFPALGADVTLGETRSEAGSVAIPVELTAQSENGIAGLQFDFQFDEDELVFWDVSTGEAAEQADRDIMFNQLDDGTIRVVVAGFDETTMQDGTVVTLHFDTVDPEASPEAAFSLDKVVLSGFHGEIIDEALPEEEALKSSESNPSDASIAEHATDTVSKADAASEQEDAPAVESDGVALASGSDAQGPSKEPSPKNATAPVVQIAETLSKPTERTRPALGSRERPQPNQVARGFDNVVAKRAPNPHKAKRQFSGNPREIHDVAANEKPKPIKVASFLGHPRTTAIEVLSESVHPGARPATARQSTAARTALAYAAVLPLLVVIIAIRRRIFG
jgi:hypothetical protein